MLFELWIAIVAFALFKGGKFQFFNSITIRYPLVIFICFLLYFLMFLFYDVPIVAAHTSAIYQIVLLVLLVALSLNWRNHGFPLILVGFVCNILVIIANNGLMPVSYSGIMSAGLSDHLPELLKGDGKHVIMSTQTRLRVLGDLIPLARPYGMKQVVSLGDVVLSIGIAQFLFQGLTKKTDIIKRQEVVQ